MDFRNPLSLAEGNLEKTKILLSMTLDNIYRNGIYEDLLIDSIEKNTRFLVKSSSDNKFQKFRLNGFNYIVIPKDLVDEYESMTFTESCNDFADKIITLLGMNSGFVIKEEDKEKYESNSLEKNKIEYKKSIENIFKKTGEKHFVTKDYEYDGIDIDVKNDFIKPKFYSERIKKDESDESSSGEGGTESELSMESEGALSEVKDSSSSMEKAVYNLDKKNLEQSMEIVDQVVSEEIKKSVFYHSDALNKYKFNFELLNKLSDRVEKALKGHTGKIKKYNPTKRISSKSIATDSDKMYVGKSIVDGRHIKMNFIVDMSGSMSGEPMQNSASILYIMNKLAKKGLIEGNILYSTTRENMCVKMPLQDKEILSLVSTGSAEGIATTISNHTGILRNKNCICLTDGDICDSPIEKVFWTRNNIISTGMYATSSYKYGESDYDQSLNNWFNHTILAKDVEGLVERIIQVGLK
jgi:hypothetical protein